MKFVMVLSAIAALLFIVEGAKAETVCEALNRDMPGACKKVTTMVVPDVTVASCLEAFSTSSAKQTCIAPQAWVKDENKCKIKAGCQTKEYNDWQWTDITVAFGYVDDLYNCDGDLQIGGCS